MDAWMFPKLLLLGMAMVCGAAFAQADNTVTVEAMKNRVDKSYRKMVAGMDHFEKKRSVAPNAQLRFKLLPRHRDTRMENVQVEVLGDSFETPVAVAADHSFTLERDRTALRENASVRPNRKKQTMTWRADIRTPGLPPGTRRLGDLRLECEVGIEAGLVSNTRPTFIARLADLLPEGSAYCSHAQNRYLFFADRPIFGVTLVHGARREAVPIDRLYASATRDAGWKKEIPYCDCEVLLDRTYFLPLGDKSWPDDTRVEFEYMDSSQ